MITVENDGNEISYEPSAHEIPKNITINDPTANPYSDGNITSYELSQEPTKLENEINTPTGKEEKDKEKTKGYTAKITPIINDLGNSIFPLRVTGRKQKGGRLSKLKQENFDSDFTTKIQAGFSTNSPIRWALALEQFIAATPNVKCSWQYKTNQKTKKYSECYVTLQHAIYLVNISITFNNGTFIVEGDHKYWTENEFPKVAELFKIQKEYNNGDEINEKQLDEVSSSVDCLWIKNEELRRALANQDTVIASIIDRCKNTEIKTNEINPKNLTLEIEEKFDNKVIIVMNFMMEEFKSHTDTMKKEFTTQIRQLKEKIEKLEKYIKEGTHEANNHTSPIAFTDKTRHNEDIPALNKKIADLEIKLNDIHCSLNKAPAEFGEPLETLLKIQEDKMSASTKNWKR